MVGQHGVVRRRADGAAVDGAGPDPVERAAVAVDGAAEEPVRQAQLEGDDVRQGEDGHLVAVVAGDVLRAEPVRHGRIFAHVGFRATGLPSVGLATLER